MSLSPRRWALWEQRRATVAFVLVIEAVVMAVAVALVLTAPHLPLLTAGAWPGTPAGVRTEPWPAALVACLLAAAGVAHQEVVRAVERTRRFIAHHYGFTYYGFNSTGAWTFTAALILPPILAMAVVAVIYLHAWARSWRARTPLYRTLFSATSVALGAVAAFATATALHELTPSRSPGIEIAATRVGDLAVVVLAGFVFAAVNHLLVTAAVAIADRRESGRRWSGLWGSREDYVLEATTLCLGALTAALMTVSPVLVVLVPAPLIVLTRAALVRELRQALDTDHKTGLLTSTAWHSRAERLLEPAPPPRRRHREIPAQRTGRTALPRPAEAGEPILGVLMCDIDHFKRINDRYGHLAGDHVLRSIAETLTGAVRPTDLVARFGGEEFLIMLVIPAPTSWYAASDPTAVVVNAAERIRARIAAMRIEIPTPDGPLTIAPLTMSIGAVAVPVDGGRRAGVVDLVSAADSAVYSAKRAGRDRVHAVSGRFTARATPPARP